MMIRMPPPLQLKTEFENGYGTERLLAIAREHHPSPADMMTMMLSGVLSLGNSFSI